MDPREPGPGEAWTDGAECLAGDSCWCSAAPAPSVAPPTRAPSDGNSNSGRGKWQGCGASHFPNTPDSQICDVTQSPWPAEQGAMVPFREVR